MIQVVMWEIRMIMGRQILKIILVRLCLKYIEENKDSDIAYQGLDLTNG